MTLKNTTKIVEFNEYPCPAYSKPIAFQVKIKIFPSEWDENQSRTWKYRFEHKYGTNKVLEVTLSKHSG